MKPFFNQYFRWFIYINKFQCLSEKAHKDMLSVCIFTADSNGGYPVPAVKGGAVSTLVEHLVVQNQIEKKVNMTVVSFYDEDAVEASKKYPYIDFVWVQTPQIIKGLDSLLFNVIRKVFKKKKAISYRTLCSLLFYIVKSKGILKKRAFDYVILENNIPLAWIIKLSSYSGRYYYHFHNVPRINARCRDVFSKCNGYLCVSEFIGSQIASPSNPIGPVQKNKISVLYNCIDTNHFNPMNFNANIIADLHKKFGIKGKDRIIIFVGRLSEEKGIDQILRAMKIISSKNVKLLIVGSLFSSADIQDEYQQEIVNLADELGDKIVFTGYIDQSQLPNLYCMSDIAVLPSMWDEPAGLTMIEAMACGIPVITTCSGGIPEYVGECAYVLERNEKLDENIAKTIDSIFNHKEEAEEKSKAGIDRISRYFSSEKYLDNMMEILNGNRND